MAKTDFIETFPGALAPEACAALVAKFEASAQARAGTVGDKVVPEMKRSRDISITGKAEWREAEELLNRAMFAGLLAYLRKYPYLLLSPLTFQYVDPDTQQPRRMRADDIDRMDDETLTGLVLHALRPGGINLQHYHDGSGGFPAWHCEQSPGDPRAEQLHRALLWTIYLNDGFEAGETEFLYQEHKVVPRTGTLLLAPTAFTHTHRGNVPLGRDKYIATSWVLYRRFEHMIGNSQ
jgi:hypothetical protein